jgi:hypothetical protein
MGSFVNNLVDRSTESTQSIRPRLRGKFERDITSPDFFTGNDATTFIGEPAETQDEQFPIRRRGTTVGISLLKNIIDESVEDTRQLRISKPLPANTPPIKDDITPEKPPRFEPSYELFAPQNMYEHASAERQGDTSNYVQTHPNTKISADEVRQDDSRQAQILPKKLHAPSTTPAKARNTKEIYKSLPVVKAAPDLVAPAEVPPKAHIKQPSASLRQEKTSPVGHSQTINISIGRIEVRVSQPPGQLPLKPKSEGVAIMSLDEYLRKRNQGS